MSLVACDAAPVLPGGIVMVPDSSFMVPDGILVDPDYGLMLL